MKHFYTKLLFFGLLTFLGTGLSFGQALSAGDIAFVAFNADGDDDFAFVALTDIPANTSIWFTDNEWTGTSFNNLNEGELEWSHTSLVAAGTIIVIEGIVPSTNIGSISGAGFNLSGSNEDILALLIQPSTSTMSSPGFLAGISNDLSGSDTVLTGTGLTDGTDFIDFSNDSDGFEYNGLRAGESNFSDYLPFLMSSSNWQIESSNGENIIPISTAAFSILTGPDNPSVFSASAISSTQIDLDYDDNAAGDDVIIVFNTDNTFSTPSGMPPTAGTAFAGGEVLVNASSVAGPTPFNHTGLDANTTYFYRAYSYDGSDYSNGIELNETTPAPTYSTFPYTDDFETANNDWLSSSNSNTEWERGAPSDTDLNSANSGTNAYGTDLDSNYLNDTEATLTSPIFDNSANAFDLRVSFQYWVNSEADWDGLFLEYSNDGGGSWTKLINGTSNWYNNLTDDWWDGTTSSGFTQAIATIPNSANDADVQVRFIFSSDGSNNEEGALIDDFEINLASSVSSDIIATSFDPTDDIDYTLYSVTSVLTNNNAIKIGEFTLRDGGASSDADGLATTLTDLTFDINNHTNLAAIALFSGDGSSDDNLSEITSINASSTFSGLNIIADDNDSVTFSVYATFLSTVTDNQQLEFSISSATANTSGSLFVANDAGNASTPTSGNDNRIEVTATDLLFNQDVSDVPVGVAMSPFPTVEAYDSNVNLDLDFTEEILLTPSGASFGALATSSVTAIDGVATFSGLFFDATATNVTLTASYTGLVSDTSSAFDVNVAPVNPTQGDLFITEVSDASDFNNEFIEIHNTSASAIDLSTTKLVMLNDGTVWDLSDFILNPIPSNGFAIISRGNPIANFESEFGTLNVNTVFIEGSAGMFFGNGRRWQIFAGGTTNTADGVLLDDTITGVADGDRDFQNIFNEEFINTPDNLANPGELDYLLYNNGEWVNNEVADGSTSTSDVYFFEDFTSTSAISMNNGGIKSPYVLNLDSNNLSINGTFTFKSDSNGSAQLADATGATITGEVTVERYIPANRAYRLLSSPVTTSGTIFENWQENGIYPTSANGIGTHITGFQGTVGQFDASSGLDQTASGNPSMFTFDNVFVPTGAQTQFDGWDEVASTNQTGDNLIAETPYLLFVRGDRSIDLASNSSTPNNTTLSATGNIFTGLSTQTLSGQPQYFSLVANPFQAIVDFNALTFTGLGNPNFMYVYDSAQKDYVALQTGTNDSDMFIRPGQSVFVVNSPGTATASTVQFEQTDINTSPGPGTIVFSDDFMAKLELELYNDSGELRENLRISFEDNASNAIDEFDAPKLTGGSEILASVNSGNIYTIERRAQVQSTDQVSILLDQYQGTDYEFRVKLENWNPDVEIFVADNYLGTTNQITPDQAYVFTVDSSIPESISENRFSLVFDNTTLGVDDNAFGSDFALYPNPTTDGQFSIKTTNLSGEVDVEITSLLGQNIYSKELSITGTQVDVNATGLSSGVYVVKLTQGNQSFSTKLIVE